MAQLATEWSTPREPHSDLLAPMLPYQKEGLGWMCSQEIGEVHRRPYLTVQTCMPQMLT